MDNVLSYDEYNVDVSLSEGLLTLEFIKLLMEEEHMAGMDYIDEGFSFSKRIPGTMTPDNTARFVPGENDSSMTNTKIFSDEDPKKFKYYVQRLEKSGIDSINWYKFGNILISKILKHPEEYKLGKFTEDNPKNIDDESIKKFFKRSALYIRSIIKEQKFDIDIITYPKSSSHFNEILTKYVMEGYSNIDSIKVISNLFTKDIQTVEVNRERAKDLGMTDEEIDKLEHKLESWKKDYKYIYPLRLELDRLKDKLTLYMSEFDGKRGRRPKVYYECIEDIKEKEEEIKNVKKSLGKKGRDRTKDSDGRARDFQIKSLDDKTRKAIENLFTLNKGLDNEGGKTIEERIKGKNIVIFDDNISSGATLDDMCLTLQKCGAKSILPITMAIIPPTAYGNHDNDFKNR